MDGHTYIKYENYYI